MNQILHPLLKPISYEFFFWVHLLPPGNKFFIMPLRVLFKAMATNPRHHLISYYISLLELVYGVSVHLPVVIMSQGYNNYAFIVKFSSNCCRDFSAVLSCERFELMWFFYSRQSVEKQIQKLKLSVLLNC